MKNNLYTSFLLLLFMISCGTTTNITGSWANKETFEENDYQNIFITAITSNVPVKTIIENELAYHIEQRDIKATKSHMVLPETFSKDNKPSKIALLKAIKDTGSDAIITVTLRDTETESRYVSGAPAQPSFYSPMRHSYYSNFYGYYNSVYSHGYNADYYTTDKIYYLETNIYDVETEQLIWSAQSKTYNPSDLENFTKGYTKALVKQLKTDGVITDNE